MATPTFSLSDNPKEMTGKLFEDLIEKKGKLASFWSGDKDAKGAHDTLHSDYISLGADSAEDMRLRGALRENEREFERLLRKQADGKTLEASEVRTLQRQLTEQKRELADARKQLTKTEKAIGKGLDAPEKKVEEFVTKIEGALDKASKLDGKAYAADADAMAVKLGFENAGDAAAHGFTVTEKTIEVEIHNGSELVKAQILKDGGTALAVENTPLRKAQGALERWEDKTLDNVRKLAREYEEAYTMAGKRFDMLEKQMTEVEEKVVRPVAAKAEAVATKIESQAAHDIEHGASKGVGFGKMALGTAAGAAVGYAVSSEENKTSGTVIGGGIGALGTWLISKVSMGSKLVGSNAQPLLKEMGGVASHIHI